MKKIFALLLVFVMLMSLAACGDTKKDSTKNPTEAPTEAPTETPTEAPTEPEITDYKMVNDFIFSVNGQQVMAYDNGDGTIYVDLTTDVIKRGTVDAAAWDTISKALATSGYDKLEEFYDGDGMNMSSLSVSFADGSFFSCECYAEAPAELVAVFDAMVACFKEVTKDLDEYVPVPMEMGVIADSDRAALDAILANLELPVPADAFAINGIAKEDEFFAQSLGLSSANGIASGLTFGPMSTSVAYSMSIVTLEDAATAEAVAADFESSIDWAKMICVMPESAYIAVKGDQVLCLLGSQDFYSQTVTAIEADGWTVYATVDNPDM